MNRPRTRLVAVLAACAVAATACSGGDDSVSPTTATDRPEPTVSPATTVPETTVVETTAPEPTAPSTEASTTSSTTEVVPPTTDQPVDTTLPEGVPPRVTFPDDPELQAVVDAYYAYDDALVVALREPADDQLRADVLALTGEPQTTRVAGLLDRLVESGEAGRRRSEPSGYVDVFAHTVFALDDLATLDACVVDTDLLVEVAAGDDGSDLVVDDQITSFVDTYSLKRVDGRWVVNNTDRVGTFEDQLGCG